MRNIDRAMRVERKSPNPGGSIEGAQFTVWNIEKEDLEKAGNLICRIARDRDTDNWREQAKLVLDVLGITDEMDKNATQDESCRQLPT